MHCTALYTPHKYIHRASSSSDQIHLTYGKTHCDQKTACFSVKLISRVNINTNRVYVTLTPMSCTRKQRNERNVQTYMIKACCQTSGFLQNFCFAWWRRVCEVRQRRGTRDPVRTSARGWTEISGRGWNERSPAVSRNEHLRLTEMFRSVPAEIRNADLTDWQPNHNGLWKCTTARITLDLIDRHHRLLWEYNVYLTYMHILSAHTAMKKKCIPQCNAFHLQLKYQLTFSLTHYLISLPKVKTFLQKMDGKCKIHCLLHYTISAVRSWCDNSVAYYGLQLLSLCMFLKKIHGEHNA